MEKKAVVAGVGITPFGSFPDKSFVSLGKEAVNMALKDAGMSFRDIEVVVGVNSFLSKSTVGVMVTESLGRMGIPVLDVDAACAGAASTLGMIKDLIESGKRKNALIFGVEKMPKGFMPPTVLYNNDWQVFMGLDQNPMYWAMMARRHMHDYGTTVEQFAKVVIKNRAIGALNPNARFRKPVTMEEVMGSPLVCDPMRLFMICAPVEGAAAVVVSEEDKATRLGSRPPLRLAAAVHVVSMYPNTIAPSICIGNSGNPSRHELAAQRAYKAAGVSASDIDFAEVQDTDAFCEIEAYEGLGFCKKGEGGSLATEGVTERTGRKPVNTDGGLLSKGEPVGASHLGQLYEVAKQLRGEAGERQIPRKVGMGLAHVSGAGGHCGITVLERIG
jgi:acetyl-CoA acetyltransferase